MKTCRLRFLYFIFLSNLFLSCISLKYIQHYASASGTALIQYEQTGYTFEKHCRERCYTEPEKHGDIERSPVCACESYRMADEITNRIYSAISSYFLALTKLSENGLTQIQTTTLQKAITAGDFGDLQISDEHVRAFTDISSILLRSVTEHYRRKQVRDFILKADSPIQVLIQKFNFILTQNLSGEIDFRKAALYDMYKEISLEKNNSSFTKLQAAKSYYGELQNLQNIQSGIQLFSKSLLKIAEGHHRLSLNANRLTGAELVWEITQTTSDINSLLISFHQLRN